MRNKLFAFLPFLIVFILSLITIFPLFHVGFFPIHDNTQVQRVFEMSKSLKDSMLPVRWVNDLGYGYGYPLFNFYGPLAYYIGGIFAFFVDSLLATKIMIGLAMIGSGLTMYLFAKSLWGKTGGLLTATLYLFAPYHAVDLYVRGDIGELWAYMFVPLLFLGLYKVFTSSIMNNSYPKKSHFTFDISHFQGIVLSTIGFTGIILSHNLSAFMITPFLLLVGVIGVFFSKDKFVTACTLLFAAILAVGLSAFYVLPVFGELRYTNVLSQIGGGADFHNHFVCLSQLWQSQWGFGGSTKGCIDGLSFMIGKIHIMLSIGSVLLLPFLWTRKQTFLTTILCIVGLFLATFMMLPFSQNVWEKIPQMAFLQYPWRYLLLTSFFSSLLGGMVGSFIFEKDKKIGTVFVIFALVSILFLNSKYFQPQSYSSTTSMSLTSLSTLQWTTSKISDEYMPKGFVKPQSPQELPQSLVIHSPTLTVQSENVKTHEKNITLLLTKPQYVFLSVAYFPAWEARDNNHIVRLDSTNKGMKVYLTSGTHHLSVTYASSLIENMGNMVSLTSVVILILGIIWMGKKTYDYKSS